MAGSGGNGDYPSERQAAELERLSRQLDDLRQASHRQSPGRSPRPQTGLGDQPGLVGAQRGAAGVGRGAAGVQRGAAGVQRGAAPRGDVERSTVRPMSGDTIGLDAERKARRPASLSATTRAMAAQRASTGVAAKPSGGRPRGKGLAVGDVAAVLPFRRAEALDDEAADDGSRRRGSAAGRGRTPADREARKAASRAAAADAFAAQLEADPEEAARDLCLAWLAVRPHTRAELAAKLRRKNVPVEAMATVLDRYGEVGLIDDAAFANAWVDSRHTGRGLAKRALAYELRSRGVDGATIEAAVGRLETSDEEATARALVTRKLAGMGHVAPEARARRLMGMLARKGYPGGMAASVVREVIAGSGVDIPDPDDD